MFQKYVDINFFPEADKFDTFVDLFAGSCASALWIHDMYPEKNIVINDLNTELITLYQHIRNDWDKFLPHYERYVAEFMEGTPEERKALYDSYKPVYAFDYEKYDPVEISALLLVMLKVNFNGIWKSYIKWNNRYSTPAGTMKYKAGIFDVDKLIQFRDFLRKCEVTNVSYADVPIPENSWIFADPPYRATEKMYSDQFDDTLQLELGAFLKGHEERGCLFAESNKDINDGFWQNLFPNHHIHLMDHKYTCGRGGTTPVVEILIKNYGKVEETINPLQALVEAN